MARVAEQSERYADMVDFLKPLIDEKGSNMSTDERNLLASAFKNQVGLHRVAHRTIKVLLNNERYIKFKPSLTDYLNKVSKRLHDACENVINIVKTQILVKPASKEDSKVYYMKLLADYMRYKSEVLRGEDLDA
jgi:hypothetical protein